MAQRDVDLIIRARDKASKVLKDVVNALESVEKQQGSTAKSGKGLGATMTGLADAAKRLDAALDSVVAAGRLSTEMDRAARSLDKVQTEAAATAKELDRLNTEQTRAAQVAQRFRDKAAAASEILKQQRAVLASVKKAGGENAEQVKVLEGRVASLTRVYKGFKDQAKQAGTQQRALGNQIKDTSAIFDRQAQNVARAEAELEQFGAAAAEATGKVAALKEASRDRIGGDIAKQRDLMEQVAASYEQVRQEANQLAAALKGVENPTREQTQAARLAEAAAAQLRKEFILQRETLTQLEAIFRNADKTTEGFIAAQREMQAVVAASARSLAAMRQEAAKAASAITAIPRTPGGGVGGPRGPAGPVGVPRVDPAPVERMRSAFTALYGESRKAMSMTQRWRGEVLALVAAYGGLFGVISLLNQAVQAAQQMEAVTARLNVALEGTGRAPAEELDFLRRTADRLGVSLGGLAQEYSKFAIATRGTNIDAEETRKIFVAVAEAARVNRNSQAEMQGVFTALTQIVSKGVVQMEELRQQLGDRLPGAIQMMADALGVSNAELFRMVEAGEVTSDALIPFAEELTKKFGGGLQAALAGTSAELGRLGNAAYQALLVFANAGFLESFNELVRSTTEMLQSAAFLSTVERLSGLFALLADAVRLCVENFQLFAAAVGVLVGIKLTGFVVALGAGFAALAPKVIAGVTALRAAVTVMPAVAGGAARASAAMTGLSLAVRGLLSATGIGLAVTVITGALAYWATSATDASTAMEAHRTVVDAVKNAYEETQGSMDDFIGKLEGVSRAQAEVALQRTREEAEALREELMIMGSGQFLTTGSLQSLRAFGVLRQEMIDGKISAQQYKDALDVLADSDPSIDLAEISEIQDAADKVAEVEKRMTDLEAVVVLFDKTASAAMKDAALVTLGLKEAAEETGESFEAQLVAKAEQFAAAMEELRAKIPEVKAELDRLNESEAIKGLLLKSLQMATSWGQVAEAIRTAGAAQLALNEGAVNSAVSGSLVDRIIGVESGGNPSAKNPLSSATGLGQFIESTWLRMFKQYFPDRAAGMSDAAILALREDAEISRNMVELYLRENATHLQNAGAAITDANLYLAHFLGPGGAVKLLNSAPGTVMNDIFGPGVINANASIMDGKTREDVIAWAQRKVGVSAQELDIQEQMIENDQERAAEAEEAAQTAADFHAETNQSLEDARQELGLVGATNVERETALALREAERAAAAAGTQLTEQQRQAIIATTREKYAQQDIDAAKEATLERVADAEEKVNLLLEQRNALEEQLAMAVTAGDAAKQEDLKSQIASINGELTQAIVNAQEMWRAVGGQAAETAIARLETAKLKADEFGASGKQSWIDWKRVGDLFVSGLTNAFDRFAQSVAEGKSIGESAREAFLQFASDFLREIAQMIMRQAILNALQGTKVGGFLGIGAAHSGGMIGSKRAGSGNPVRQVSPAVFAGAQRFHSGGMPGLAPNEVPIIAEMGEEVLTRDDPRHMLNGGGSGSPKAPTIRQKIVNAIDAPSFLSAAMATREGEEIILNFLRANADAVRAATA